MKKLAALITIICSLSWISAGWAANGLHIDRSGFGNSALPIWSELTPFEETVIADASAARAGDADALLGLYLVAGGESRDWASFRYYQQEIDSWLAENKLGRKGGDARRGRDLYIGMHREFFGPEPAPMSVPDNYRAEQSQLSEIFESERFNCISSSMLYIVIARKAGLDVDGVVLPSHAFVQLNTEDGNVLEIETTSLAGFGQVHDEAFYDSSTGNWFSDRDLAPPTFEDYLDREIVSPYELGLFNMTNQHTAEDRMSHADRMRLAEIRAQQMPRDVAAQKSRLAYYYQEFAHFSDRGDYVSAMRMFDQVGPYLDDQAFRHRDDPEFVSLLTAVEAQRAETLVQQGRQQEGLELARALLQDRNLEVDPFGVENHLFSVISRYAVNRADDADYPGAREVFNSLEDQCLQNKVCNSGLAHVYSTWALHYVEDRNWRRSVDVYQEYLLLDNSSNISRHFSTNLERAYLNWAAVEEWSGEWESAMGLLNQCTQALDGAERCASALRELDEKHDSGYL